MTPTEGPRRLVIVRRLREICDRDRSCFSSPTTVPRGADGRDVGAAACAGIPGRPDRRTRPDEPPWPTMRSLAPLDRSNSRAGYLEP